MQTNNAPMILGANGLPMVPSVRPSVRSRVMASAYEGATSDHPAMANWSPSSYSGQSALSMSRTKIVDRVNDLVRSDGWASAGVSRLIDNIIGNGWTLLSQPNHRSLNITAEEANDISEQIEALWTDFAQDVDFWCDAERSKSMAGILGLAARHRFGPDGEAMAILIWQDDAPVSKTGIQILDPARVSNPNMKRNSDTLQDGVETDQYGAPQAYWVQKSHPGDRFLVSANSRKWERVERWTEWGRPVFVHAFDQQRAGMTRGVSDWAPILRPIKQATNYEDAEAQAAMLNAVMAVFIETPFDAEELLESLEDAGPKEIGDFIQGMSEVQQSYYKENPLHIRHANINMLKPGEKPTLMRPEHPNANFEIFVNAALRKIASAVGLTYEQLTMDWSNVNYSSARAALLEIWRGFMSKRGGFAANFMMPIYRAWLEEVFDKGRVVVPIGAVSFWENPSAWCQSEWIGPGRGWVDPLKEVKAAELRMKSGLSSPQDEAAQQGKKWRDIIDQKIQAELYEAARRREHGLPVEPVAAETKPKRVAENAA